MAKTAVKNLTAAYYGLFAILSAAYVLLTYFAPITTNTTYNLSTAQIRLIIASFILPIVAIWFIAVYGGVHFKKYVRTVQTSDEGKALNQIANGLLVLSFGLIVTSGLSTIKGYFHTDVQLKTFTVFINYINLVVQLAVYWLMFSGSNGLVKFKHTKVDDTYSRRQSFIFSLTAGIVALYSYMMFRNVYRQNSPDIRTINSFFLPDSLLLTTIVMPYAIVWVLASATILNLLTYLQTATGVVYRQAIKRLMLGLVTVVGFSILMSVLSTLSSLFSGASLKLILIFVYVILVAYAVGFIIIASGAKRLAKIEEVAAS